MSFCSRKCSLTLPVSLAQGCKRFENAYILRNNLIVTNQTIVQCSHNNSATGRFRLSTSSQGSRCRAAPDAPGEGVHDALHKLHTLRRPERHLLQHVIGQHLRK